MKNLKTWIFLSLVFCFNALWNGSALARGRSSHGRSGGVIEIHVRSAYDEARLFIDGKFVGRGRVNVKISNDKVHSISARLKGCNKSTVKTSKAILSKRSSSDLDDGFIIAKREYAVNPICPSSVSKKLLGPKDEDDIMI